MGHAKKESSWIVIDRVADIILNDTEGCVVDIGMGLSTKVLAKHASTFKRFQYSCDIDSRQANKYSNLHPKHNVFIGSSFEFIKTFSDTPAIVFLDGKHSYLNVKTEFDFFLDKLVPNGVIFIHDTFPFSELLIDSKGNKCGEAYKIRQELEERNDLDIFTWTYRKQAQNCGLSMIRKKDLTKPFYQL